MSPDSLFSMSSTLALAGWIGLLVFYQTTWIGKVLTGSIVAILCVFYTWLIATNLAVFEAESFSSLDHIASLFKSREALLAGWIHYLAFDLLTGIYMVNNARLHGIGFWPLLPCLFFTFVLGPFGLLLYILLRWFQTGKYFTDTE